MLLNAPLKTEHLVLKNLEPSDASGPYKEWVNDPEVNRYLELRRSPPDEAKLSSFISNMNISENNLFLGIFVQDGVHIGNIKLGPININNYRGMIGLFIGDKNFWGKGFATEAILAITDYAFGSLNLNRVEAGLYSSNISSLKAFLKAGFEAEGKFKNYWKINDGWEDQLFVAKVRN